MKCFYIKQLWPYYRRTIFSTNTKLQILNIELYNLDKTKLHHTSVSNSITNDLNRIQKDLRN